MNSKYSKTLSIVTPAFNEEEVIEKTLVTTRDYFVEKDIPFEFVVVDDRSTDSTKEIIQKVDGVKYIYNDLEKGVGGAIRKGLSSFSGDCVVLVTADGSDSPEDIFNYYQTYINEGSDAVFGTRFHKDSKLVNYPAFKLLLNRVGNKGLSFLLGLKTDDLTNSFKLYDKKVIKRILPLKSSGFEITIELSLKSIFTNMNYVVVPNSWQEREAGVSKMKVLKTAFNYLLTVGYCLSQKRLLSREK